MARVDEDESAGLVNKKFVGVGERWLHPESGHVVTTEFLHVVGDVVKKGELYSFYGVDALAKSDISAMSQCVLYTGFDGSTLFVRTVVNFFEKFEMVV